MPDALDDEFIVAVAAMAELLVCLWVKPALEKRPAE